MRIIECFIDGDFMGTIEAGEVLTASGPHAKNLLESAEAIAEQLKLEPDEVLDYILKVWRGRSYAREVKET